jgi:hypothetical protein
MRRFASVSSISDPATHDPSAYDLVAVGSRSGNMSVSSHMRSYLMHERDRLPAIAFFCTCGRAGASARSRK